MAGISAESDPFEPLGAERGIITKVEVDVALERAIVSQKWVSRTKAAARSGPSPGTARLGFDGRTRC
jgi:hypothetical protein